MRILGESIDFSRQAQAAALRLRAPEAPEVAEPAEPIRGVTLSEKPAPEEGRESAAPERPASADEAPPTDEAPPSGETPAEDSEADADATS